MIRFTGRIDSCQFLRDPTLCRDPSDASSPPWDVPVIGLDNSLLEGGTFRKLLRSPAPQRHFVEFLFRPKAEPLSIRGEKGLPPPFGSFYRYRLILSEEAQV